MINFLKRLLGFHDNNGLKYSVDHLAKIKDEIVFYPVEEQAKYADVVCIELINDLQFNDDAYHSLIDFHPDENLNATSVGNAAYLSLNSPIQSVREAAMDWLIKLREYNQEKC